MIAIKNILVPTDFGEPSNAALEYGRQLARALGATLHVLHIVRNVAAEPVGVEGFTTDYGALQREAEEAARTQLGAVVAAEDWRSIAVKTMTITSNTPAPAIVSYAEGAHADLVVVGTRVGADPAHHATGSIAEAVLQTAPCPVLFFRQPQYASSAADVRELAARTTR